jgi:acetylglutamate kinase
MEKLTVVKIGGKVIDDEKSLDAFLTAFSKVEGLKLLVHGGGKIASDFGKRLGIEPQLIDGRRITDQQTIDIVTMVYGGLVSKRIVSKLQAQNINAIGLTGADANIIPANKRPVKTIDFGFVGDIELEKVNGDTLVKLIEIGLLPVMAPLTHDQKGNMLNTNADTIAATLASVLAKQYEVNLIYCFEQPGVLSDFEKKTVIPEILTSQVEGLKNNGTISEGMIPKIDCATMALGHGVKKVLIGAFDELEALAQGNSGTLIK